MMEGAERRRGEEMRWIGVGGVGRGDDLYLVYRTVCTDSTTSRRESRTTYLVLLSPSITRGDDANDSGRNSDEIRPDSDSDMRGEFVDEGWVWILRCGPVFSIG
jgi:hypothetical protein